jgi:hypothetical protein
MGFKEIDVVALKKDVRSGDVDVEFMDSEGGTLGLQMTPSHVRTHPS